MTSSKTDNRPSFQFYPDDWLSEPGLRACSLSARGLWTDLLCYMWQSPQRGRLRWANGTPMTIKDIARLSGTRPGVVDRCVRELKDYGVLSYDAELIICRRMARIADAVDTTSRKKSIAAQRRWNEKADKDREPPLSRLPESGKWMRMYHGACKKIHEQHPRVPIPEPGTSLDIEWQNTIRLLHEADNYSYEDCLATFRWLFRSEEDNARFWRKQVASLGNLRGKKQGDPRTKFDKIAEAAQLDKPKAPEDPEFSKWVKEQQAANRAKEAREIEELKRLEAEAREQN